MMSSTQSNFPNRYLVHICPQCSFGQAVPATSEEINQWRLGVQVRRQCPNCTTIDLVIQEVVERRNGRVEVGSEGQNFT
jgi:hypothetical protein